MMTLPLIDGRSVFRRSKDVVCRQVGNEAILVPIRNNVGNLDFVYTLSPVAARLWELLDGTRTADEILEIICREYDVSREAAMTDLTAFVADLSEVSLCERES